MKPVLLMAALFIAAACFAQPAEKKLYILYSYRRMAGIPKISLQVNGRIVRVPNRSFVEIPITGDSIQINVLNPQFRKRAQNIRMAAATETYLKPYITLTKGYFHKAVFHFQLLENCACWQEQYKRYKHIRIAAL